MLPIPQSRSRRAEMDGFLQAAHDANQARRDRVLQYEDLTKALTQAPFSISDPERWNGWIPPATVPGPVPPRGWDQGEHPEATYVKNDSPVRDQLVAIAQEAYWRDQQDGQS